MSRTLKVKRNENPAKFFISFDGQNGKMSFKEGETFTEIKYPFSFVVVDADCKKVTGKTSQKPDAKAFSSNITHPNYTKPVYNVSIGGKFFRSGKWNELRTLPELEKARISSLIYVIFQHGENLELGQMSIHGRTLARWIETMKVLEGGATGNYLFTISGMEKKSSDENALESFVPVITVSEVPEDSEIIQAAIISDSDLLQPYLSQLLEGENDGETAQDMPL